MLVTDRLIDSAPAIVLVLDADGRIVSYNPYAERVLGYRLAEVKGRDWFDTFHPEDERERIERVSRAIVNRLHHVPTTRIRRPREEAGNLINLLATVRELFALDGDVENDPDHQRGRQRRR